MPVKSRSKRAILASLKACPFCKSRKILIKNLDEDSLHISVFDEEEPRWVAWCFDCKAVGPHGSDPSKAARLWNRRGKNSLRT